MQVTTLLRSSFGGDIEHARFVALLLDGEPDHFGRLGVERQLVGSRRALKR
jgi:hypothetical protein